MRVHHLARLFPAVALAAAVVACDQAPIEWKDPAELGGTDTLGRLTVDSNGHASVDAAPGPPVAISASDVAVCPGSIRGVKGTAHVFAVWWGMRADSAATLFVSSTTPTGNWAEAKRLAVDTTDMSKAGCDRPAPSVTTVGDDVFVAYSLHAPEGRGVFFAHTMGGMVHEPVPVVYGERVVTTAIAAQDQRVLVAYEEANGTRRRINVAISEDQGHTFGWHVPASRDVDIGRDPDVALAGDRLAVSWMAAGGADSANSRVVRVGRLR